MNSMGYSANKDQQINQLTVPSMTENLAPRNKILYKDIVYRTSKVCFFIINMVISHASKKLTENIWCAQLFLYAHNFCVFKRVLLSVYFIISSNLHHYLTGAYVKFKACNHYFEIND